MSVPTEHPEYPRPANFQVEIYKQGQEGIRPRFPLNSEDWPNAAKEVLPQAAWGYLEGNAGRGETHENNREAFKKWALIPNRLVKTIAPSLGVNILGFDMPFPLMLAPVGVLKIFHADKEVGVAQVAKELGVAYTLSTASATSIEEAAEANGDGLRFYQLYWPSNEHNDITVSLLNRAKKSGFKALVVTLDTYVLGYRPKDMQNAYNPFYNPDEIGVELGFSDPVFREHFKSKHGKEVEADLPSAAFEWAQIVFPSFSHGWEDLAFLKEHWDGPIVLKGIQTIRDAKKAVEAGVQGIIVSNHAGRQVDGSIASLDVLPEIVDAVGSQIEILFDSGIRSGADIAKALALGAKGVFIGRAYAYGLAFGGKEGVKHVIRSLLADLDLCLQLSGIPSVDKKDLNRDVVRKIK